MQDLISAWVLLLFVAKVRYDVTRCGGKDSTTMCQLPLHVEQIQLLHLVAWLATPFT